MAQGSVTTINVMVSSIDSLANAMNKAQERYQERLANIIASEGGKAPSSVSISHSTVYGPTEGYSFTIMAVVIYN